MAPTSKSEPVLHPPFDDYPEAHYKFLVEHVPVGMCEVSRAGRLNWANRALVEMLGYEDSSHLLQDAELILVDELLFSRFTAAAAGATLETEWRRKDNTAFAVRLRGRVIRRNINGERLPETLAIVAEDISEQRALEERLRTTQKLEAIGRLAGGIAHDFNNMLTAILGYSDMLVEQLDEQKPIYRDLQEIGRAAKRAATLTHQLLAFSRRQMMKLEPIDVNVIVKDVEPMIRRLIGEHITVETRLADPPPIITADQSQIEQILVNLAVNARDAMPKGGRLVFETSVATLDESYAAAHEGCAPGEYVRLSVSDTGIGMTPEVRSQIFDPFFTTKSIGQGTGLGLASVYGTVRQLGGHVWVYSEPDRGAVFKLYFPRFGGVAAEVVADQPRRSHPLGAESVLLVEDELTVRTFCKSVLTRHGYQIIEAANPSEAFAALQASGRTIDLVVTDVAMPGMNGYEMVRRLRTVVPPFKAVYMSGYADQFRSGSDPDSNLLEKPFTSAQLLHCVREALDR